MGVRILGKGDKSLGHDQTSELYISRHIFAGENLLAFTWKTRGNVEKGTTQLASCRKIHDVHIYTCFLLPNSRYATRILRHQFLWTTTYIVTIIIDRTALYILRILTLHFQFQFIFNSFSCFHLSTCARALLLPDSDI